MSDVFSSSIMKSCKLVSCHLLSFIFSACKAVKYVIVSVIKTVELNQRCIELTSSSSLLTGLLSTRPTTNGSFEKYFVLQNF